MKNHHIFFTYIFSLTVLSFWGCSEKKINNITSAESDPKEHLSNKIDSLESILGNYQSANWSNDKFDIDRLIDDFEEVITKQNVFSDPDSNFHLIETKIKNKDGTDRKLPILVFEKDKNKSFIPLSESVSPIHQMYPLSKNHFLLVQKHKNKGYSADYSASILEFKYENSFVKDVEFKLNDSTYSLAYEELGNKFETSIGYNTLTKQLKVRFHESSDTNCYKCNRIFNECYLEFEENSFSVVEATKDTVVFIMHL